MVGSRFRASRRNLQPVHGSRLRFESQAVFRKGSVDLAHFLAKQGRYQEVDQSFARAEAIAPNSPKLMYAEADCYIKSKRNLNVARELLKRYMNSTLTPDDPPKSEAAKLLKQVQGS